MKALIPVEITLALALLAPSTSWASSPALGGKWRAAETAQEAAQRKKAIEETVSEVPSFFRSKARKRLQEKTRPPAWLDISVDRSTLRLKAKSGDLELELGGAPKVVAHGGKRGKVSAKRANGQLVIKLEGEQGRRTTTYSMTKAGRLRLKVRMEGSRLKKPLVYEQTFVRDRS